MDSPFPHIAVTDFAPASSSSGLGRGSRDRYPDSSLRRRREIDSGGLAAAAAASSTTAAAGESELRDGFFDALFLPPGPPPDPGATASLAHTLPAQFDKSHPLSLRGFLPRQAHELRSALRRVVTTRAVASRLARSCVAFFAAYALCLVPATRAWLGRYGYVACVSVIINHAGRTVGGQLEGAILTSAGTALGLGWGVIGLLLSTSSRPAENGFGGILAAFMALFMAASAIGRSYFIRLHQAVLCAGLAICYACLAESAGERVQWPKLCGYGVPWLIGQAIALAVNVLVLPDAGARPLAAALRDAFIQMDDALVIPRPHNTRLRRRLADAIVDLSAAHRDMGIELTVTRFDPADVRELRNLLQAMIRSLLAMETESRLFDGWDPASASADADGGADDATMRMVVARLGRPTCDLLAIMRETLRRSGSGLMDLSGYRAQLGPPADVSSDLDGLPDRVRAAAGAVDGAEASLLESDHIPLAYARKAEIARLFLFARHIRLAAATIEALAIKVLAMRAKSGRCGPRVHLPSYPLAKALRRANAQVRHDRGGVTAGHYHMTFREIARLIKGISSQDHEPLPRDDDDYETDPAMDADVDVELSGVWRHRAWVAMHRLQGFETRYAFKVVVLTALLSIPAWLGPDSRAWWNRYEAWWAVAVGWTMTHAHIGGSFQDLVVRAGAAVLGAAWSGAAYAAGGGSPIVMAVFMAVYIPPMMYRYTISSHPRSGIIGCLSFAVISLSLVDRDPADAGTSPLLVVALGLAFLVGIVGAVVINWLLWPFVARHELRKALSSMLFFLSIIYRTIVAKYVYYEEGHEPTPEDISRSELLEGRLREGFVRIRQLLGLTRHELRLRAPFDPIPYAALADACERFFEHLVALRQSVLLCRPKFLHAPGYPVIRRDPTLDADGDGICEIDASTAFGKLLFYRRDTVAAILCNLYILAGALRSHSRVPRYLPSAVAAHQRLLAKQSEIEAELEASQTGRQKNTWAEVYGFYYNESLTGCVAQLEALERYTKLIVGETGFGARFGQDEEDEDDDLFVGMRL